MIDPGRARALAPVEERPRTGHHVRRSDAKATPSPAGTGRSYARSRTFDEVKVFTGAGPVTRHWPHDGANASPKGANHSRRSLIGFFANSGMTSAARPPRPGRFDGVGASRACVCSSSVDGPVTTTGAAGRSRRSVRLTRGGSPLGRLTSSSGDLCARCAAGSVADYRVPRHFSRCRRIAVSSGRTFSRANAPEQGRAVPGRSAVRGGWKMNEAVMVPRALRGLPGPRICKPEGAASKLHWTRSRHRPEPMTCWLQDSCSTN